MPLRRCHTFLAMIDVLGRPSAVASRGTGVVRFPLSILAYCIISKHPCASCLSLGRIRSYSCRGRFIALLRRSGDLHTGEFSMVSRASCFFLLAWHHFLYLTCSLLMTGADYRRAGFLRSVFSSTSSSSSPRGKFLIPPRGKS